MSFGRKIKFYREKNGITQGKLAKGICSIPYLSKIENNKTIPSEEVLHLLCERLGISYIQKDCSDDRSIPVRRFHGDLNKKSPLGMMQGVNVH